MQKDTEATKKAQADAELIAKLIERNPEQEKTKKQGRVQRGVGRLKKLLDPGPREVILARTIRNSEVTQEIKVTLPPEKPEVTDPVSLLKGTIYSKIVTIREGDEEKGIPAIQTKRTFGPYYTNRRARRALAQMIVREMARKGRKAAKAMKAKAA